MILNKQNLKDIYNLAPLQEGMVFHNQFNPHSKSYVEQTCLNVLGDFDPEIFKRSWGAIIQKYDAFRSVIVTKKTDNPIQVVLKEYPLEYKFKDFSGFSGRLLLEKINEFKLEDVHKGFDLSKGPLFRLSILKTSEDSFCVIWTFHHIILDGWSIGIVFKDLIDFYKKIKQGEDLKVLPETSYTHYAKWLQTVDKATAFHYWKQHLKEVNKKTHLPEKSKKGSIEQKLKVVDVSLNKTLTNAIKSFSQENQLTLNSFFQTIWATCLQLWTSNGTIVFGTTVSGRNNGVKDVDKMVGLLINTIPVKFHFTNDSTFLSVATEFQKAFIESEKFSFCSLAQIQNQTSLQNDLISHLFVFENYPLDTNQENLKELGFTFTEGESFAQTEYKFEVAVFPGDEVVLRVKFNGGIYSSEMVSGLLIHFLFLSEKVLKNANEKLVEVNRVDLPLVSEQNHHYDLSRKKHQKLKNVVEMFQECVLKDPNRPALVIKNSVTTYGELNSLINIIAGNLKNIWGVKQGARIGVLSDRNESAIALFFAILKLNCAYVPIDPLYPVEKMEFMLKDSEASILIMDRKFFGSIKNENLIDIVLTDDLLVESVLQIESETTLDSCAYVIYTSGSTGIPKGCQVTNHNLASLINNATVTFDFNAEDVWITSHSFCFDFSIWEVYGALCYGASLVVASLEEVKDSSKFVSIIEKNGVTVLNQTPASFYRIINEMNSIERERYFPHLRYVIFGGDRLDMLPLKNWVSKIPLSQTSLVNMYGITETTVHVTYKLLTDKEINASDGISPIGNALPDYQVYLLDQHMRMVPDGVVGEIYVGGAGVSNGYYNRDRLNQERFIESPFDRHQRLYRSGDLAYRENGELLYLGRNDDQVQLRGFRVELGEITYRIETHPEIEKAFTLSIKDGLRDDSLVSFYTSKKELEIPYEELQAWMKPHLAEYMIPYRMYRIDAFPLTSNGKINREKLITIHNNKKSNAVEESHKEAVTPLQKDMCEIWKEILEIPKIGITNNFFELGGHSIKAILLASKMAKNLNIPFSLREIFEFPTIEKLSEYAQFKKPEILTSIPVCKVEGFNELSHAQKRMWLVDKVNGSSSIYNVQGGFAIKGDLDFAKLQKALSEIIRRHQTLRTNFIEVDDLPIQVLRKEWQFEIKKEKVTDKEQARIKIFEEINKPFDLASDELLRFSLYELNQNHFIFSVCVHHIISDGWSIGVFIDELSRIYNGEKLENLAIQYLDFVHWQNQALNSPIMNTQRDYWLRTLEGDLPALQLPTDFFRPEKRTNAGASYHFTISSDVLNPFKKYLEQNGRSLFMGLFSAFALLLHKYSRQSDMMIGVPVSGRYHPDLEKNIGYFLNTLPLRVSVDGHSSIHSFLSEIGEMTKNAFENQVYPFDLILENTVKSRGSHHNGLYDVMFTLQNFIQNDLSLSGLEVESFDVDIPVCKFDLSMICAESGKGDLSVSIEYATELYERATIENFSKHFVRVVHEIFSEPSKAVSKISMFDEAEYKLVTQDFSGLSKQSEISYDVDKSVIGVFNEIVQKYPDRISVVDDFTRLSYTELNDKANQIANYLITEKNIKKGDTICLFFNKNIETIVSILGVLKAGACYVPIDTNNPDTRLSAIIEESQCSLLLTETACFEKIKNVFSASIVVSDIKNHSTENPNIEYLGSDLAYIIFTSGSTGKPKGVMVENRSIVSLVLNESVCDIYPEDKFLQISSYAFDACIFDIFGALMNGAMLYIANHEKMLNPEYLQSVLQVHSINKMVLPTAMFNALVDFDENFFSSVDKILFGGQECSVKHVNLAFKNAKNKKSIVNVYGPTEMCTLSTTFLIEEELPSNRPIPIGSHVNKDCLYILDDDLKPVPIGVIGEIYLSGHGNSRGYLNNPSFTKERFLPNPFGGKYPLYKTNDFGRWRNDGKILFHGRKDHQIKIRGYRIELGEIETAILKYKDVLNACVLDYKKDTSDNTELVSYFVARENFDLDGLKKFLATLLPAYMIPSFFIQMDSLPLNNNGKIDKAKLPPIDQAKLSVVETILPKNEIEKILHDVWSVLLNRKEISVHENYFSLGGDSIKAIQMIAKLREKKCKVSITDLYKYPTISELANCVTSAIQNKPAEVLVGDMPVGAVHKWFTDIQKSPYDFFNQDVLLDVSSGFTYKHVYESLEAILVQHDMLRAKFSLENGDLRISLEEKVKPVLLEVSVATVEELSNVCLNLNKEIDLSNPPVMRVAFIQHEAQKYLYIVIHHFVVDGISWRIILEDLQSALNNSLLDKKITLHDKSSSYKLWTEKLIHSDIFEGESNYWGSVVSHQQKFFKASFDDDALKLFHLDGIFEVEHTQQLLTDAHQPFNTRITDLLLFAVNKALAETLGSSENLIYLEGHGRENLFEEIDLSRTVGWFTSVYPVVLSLMASDDLGLQIRHFKENLRKIPHNGVGFGVQKYLKNDDALKGDVKPLMSFNYLGQFDEDDAEGNIKFSSLKTSQTMDDRLLSTTGIELSCLVKNKKLEFHMSCSESKIDKTQATNLLEAIIKKLTEVVNFCTNTSDGGITPSDIDFDEFDISTLDNVLDNI